MADLDILAFARLFKEAYTKCFGYALDGPMTETESKIFCNKVLQQTGLSIGWKSVKNYSFFILDSSGDKQENPSVATLDTFARYVLSAPFTTEIQRKNNESHYPYWFLYKEKSIKYTEKPVYRKLIWRVGVSVAGIILIVILIVSLKLFNKPDNIEFTDYFKHTDDKAMLNNGWFVKSKDTFYWDKRNEKSGQLTLYTLKGDNWPDPALKPAIKNLLLRAVPADCFTAEVHFDNFIPKQEWQQAGILLLEDTSFSGKSIRLSLAYNDDFGGTKKPPEVLVQAITSLGDNFGKPEEIAHKPVFYLDSANKNPLLIKNLEHSALRIEKHGNKYRFLYAGGAMENGAFKEVVNQEFNMVAKYIGIFAIKGFTNSDNIPAHFSFFRITGNPCDQ